MKNDLLRELEAGVPVTNYCPWYTNALVRNPFADEGEADSAVDAEA